MKAFRAAAVCSPSNTYSGTPGTQLDFNKLWTWSHIGSNERAVFRCIHSQLLFLSNKFWEQLPSAWLNWRLILPHLPTICSCKHHQFFLHFWFQNWFNSFLELHSGQTKSTGKHLQTSSKELPAIKIKSNPFLYSGKWGRVTPSCSLQCRNPTLPTAAGICV